MSESQEVLFAAAATASALAAIEKALSRDGETLLGMEVEDHLTDRHLDFMRGYQAAYQAYQTFAGKIIEEMTKFVESIPPAQDHNIGGYL
jgi:hypothetical protein